MLATTACREVTESVWKAVVLPREEFLQGADAAEPAVPTKEPEVEPSKPAVEPNTVPLRPSVPEPDRTPQPRPDTTCPVHR